MSGHSKWSSIKHKKGAADAKRGKVFSKLAKEITVVAKQGGGDLDSNAKLRMLVQKAKEANMPGDNIDRAIKKGTGELPGVSYESIQYEGYGPAGVAVLVEALTENKNRTTAEVRNIFERKHGSLAGQGSVGWQFSKKGYMTLKKTEAEEDRLMEVAVEAGADDIKSDGDLFEVTCDPKDFEKVKKAIDDAKISLQTHEVTMIPSSTVKVKGPDAKKVLDLVDSLEDLEDVQHVYANFDIPDDELKGE
jgi:YebC/PmpR family DNA-binding regulatory protein